jgi:hypothetical protein
MPPSPITPPSFWSASPRDRAAFAQLYDLLAPRVFGLILRVLVNRSHAEEVLQEIFSRSGNPLRSSLRTRVREGVGHDDRASQGRRPRAVCAVERRPRRAGGSARTPRRRVSTSRWSCASKAVGCHERSKPCPNPSAKR